jgi:hypothetical protein
LLLTRHPTPSPVIRRRGDGEKKTKTDNMAKINQIPRIAHYSFSCPLCGTKVKKGDAYIDEDGISLCPCALPSRTLTPINPEYSKIFAQERAGYEKALKKLRMENLMMRIDFEVLISNPTGKEASKILDKYSRLRKRRNERIISVKN